MNDTTVTQFPSATGPQTADTPLGAVLIATQAPVPSSSGDQALEEPGYNRFLDLSEGASPKLDVCVVSLYGSGCFDCKHLVENGDVDYTKCHFSRGNVHCPAANLRIQFVGERVKWSKRIDKLAEMPKGVERRNAVISLSDSAREIEDESLRNYVLDSIYKL